MGLFFDDVPRSNKVVGLEVNCSIEKFSFDKETRRAKIIFLRKTPYQKIERYVTRNYQKTPIYGPVQYREKRIEKTIKLTNEALEDLAYSDDELLKEFRFKIVYLLHDPNLEPSWYKTQSLAKERDRVIANKKEALNQESRNLKTRINIIDGKIKSINKDVDKTTREIESKQKKKGTLEAKRDAKESRLAYALKIIFTLGIYFFAKPHLDQSRETRIKDLSNIISILENKKKAQERNLASESQTKRNLVASLEKIQSPHDKAIAKIRDDYNARIKAIQPLPTTICTNSTDFMPLKDFAGMSYRPIVGCYIIRNTENGRCYCGQSKDVVKRITRQHFSGTKPNNIIFAEDYYSSTLPDKSKIFEVRVIPCSTKDELDLMERMLIEKFDAFAHGYNGTNGNL